jgi:large subunit ribosomal protein L9
VSVEVILLERIQKLGKLGDSVRVAPGYARNFLIPKDKAVLATLANIEVFKQRQAELLKKEEARLAVVKARAAKINGMSLPFTMRVSDEGKLFGSVGTAEIANAIKASGGDVHKSEVVLSEGALRQIGDYQVVISLEHGEVTAKVNVIITAEG